MRPPRGTAVSSTSGATATAAPGRGGGVHGQLGLGPSDADDAAVGLGARAIEKRDRVARARAQDAREMVVLVAAHGDGRRVPPLRRHEQTPPGS